MELVKNTLMDQCATGKMQGMKPGGFMRLWLLILTLIFGREKKKKKDRMLKILPRNSKLITLFNLGWKNQSLPHDEFSECVIQSQTKKKTQKS